MPPSSHSILLHNIRSAENVGAIFRTADAAGISKIYLSGYTPTPIDRFGRPRKDIAKSALGAEVSIEWEVITDVISHIEALKKEGATIVAIEQSPRAVDYKTIVPQHNMVFLVGNEVEGIAPEILKHVDSIAEIPMHGKKESLNVSVACGIALFRILGL